MNLHTITKLINKLYPYLVFSGIISFVLFGITSLFYDDLISDLRISFIELIFGFSILLFFVGNSIDHKRLKRRFGLKSVHRNESFSKWKQAQEFSKELKKKDVFPVFREENFLTFPWLLDQLKEVEGDDGGAYFYFKEPTALGSLCATQKDFHLLITRLLNVVDIHNLDFCLIRDSRPVFFATRNSAISSIAYLPFAVLKINYMGLSLRFRAEKWNIVDNVIIAPRQNSITRKIYLNSTSVKAQFFERPGSNLLQLFDHPKDDICTFDVDVVYTWVNSENLDWIKSRSIYSPEKDTGSEATTGDRFKNRDELKFSIRSLLKYAPWVRRIFIVSNCEPPQWLDVENSKIEWVYHEQIIDPVHLPTFSSHAIESSIHKIEGLAEKFIYFNDDFFLHRPIEKTDFFLPNGIVKIRLEPYGMVQGGVRKEDPDYLNAARNVQRLLANKFSKTVTQLHTHSPHPMSLKTAYEAEATFSSEYAKTLKNRFRKITDISPTSFLYPHFAFLTGAAIKVQAETLLIQSRKDYRMLFKKCLSLTNARDFKKAPMTICINDGGGSAHDNEWNQAVVQFLDKMFPLPSEVEKPLHEVTSDFQS